MRTVEFTLAKSRSSVPIVTKSSTKAVTWKCIVKFTPSKSRSRALTVTRSSQIKAASIDIEKYTSKKTLLSLLKNLLPVPFAILEWIFSNITRGTIGLFIYLSSIFYDGHCGDSKVDPIPFPPLKQSDSLSGERCDRANDFGAWWWWRRLWRLKIRFHLVCPRAVYWGRCFLLLYTIIDLVCSSSKLLFFMLL